MFNGALGELVHCHLHLGKGYGGFQINASTNLDTPSQRLHVPVRNLQRLCDCFRGRSWVSRHINASEWACLSFLSVRVCLRFIAISRVLSRSFRQMIFLSTSSIHRAPPLLTGKVYELFRKTHDAGGRTDSKLRLSARLVRSRASRGTACQRNI